ncbi:phosphotransferase family protein [Gymnodinialimonas ceratoperidinii]|uniref:Phosphotransferase family protein n=1 Tax=Gymnodinialimonas ceratoperidinii TaxID=2856823 RepID=A0A8F6TV05_9RHOB|nr:phosphotransferase family protein [Gymnodinialimonas ceratoperidinii]QXT39476.1 phosphotransferase family protein [Gymnodinialimonas ceratoperidinii]
MSVVPPEIAALAPWLEANVPGLGRCEGFEKFGDGQSNPTFRVDASGGTFVLRAQPPGKLLKGAHRVDREARIIGALAATAVPVPRILAVSDADGPLGRMFVVMSHVAGKIYWDPALPGLSHTARTAVYDAMNETLAALHDVDPGAVGLGDFGRAGDYFVRQLATWTRQYRASETETIAAMDQLIGWLEDNLPGDDGRSGLVHGDFRLDNMIFDPETHKVAAVLDWELSTLGHPFADLAYQCMQWRLPNEGAFKGLGGVDRAATGIPSEAAYVAQYCKRRGLPEIANWQFYIAFSFFRLAAILQGVYRRSLDGNASNAQTGQQYGKAVPVLANLAMEVVATRGPKGL